jgi:hypothetical protein
VRYEQVTSKQSNPGNVNCTSTRYYSKTLDCYAPGTNLILLEIQLFRCSKRLHISNLHLFELLGLLGILCPQILAKLCPVSFLLMEVM